MNVVRFKDAFSLCLCSRFKKSVWEFWIWICYNCWIRIYNFMSIDFLLKEVRLLPDNCRVIRTREMYITTAYQEVCRTTRRYTFPADLKVVEVPFWYDPVWCWSSHLVWIGILCVLSLYRPVYQSYVWHVGCGIPMH